MVVVGGGQRVLLSGEWMGSVVVRGGLWWSVVVCGGLWWSVVVCGGLWWSDAFGGALYCVVLFTSLPLRSGGHRQNRGRL